MNTPLELGGASFTMAEHQFELESELDKRQSVPGGISPALVER